MSTLQPIDALYTGRIWRGKAGYAEALAVHDGRVLDAGKADALRAKFNPSQSVALEGSWMGPGFRDPHAHVLNLGLDQMRADLQACRHAEGVSDALSAFAAQSESEWLEGHGLNETAWPWVPAEPRTWLDDLFPDRPVILVRIDRHAAWVNSAALALAGIRGPVTVAGGELVCRDGEPTGLLVDEAMGLIRQAMPQADAGDETRAWLRAQDMLFREGLTGVADLGLPWSTWERLLPLYEDGRMRLPVYGTLSPNPETLAHMADHGPFQGERLTLRAFKYYADGALGSRGARLLADYSDAPGQRGLWLHNPEALRTSAAQHARDGFQMITHAIGDAAVRAVLDAYESAALPNDHRWRIEHAQICHTQDLPRFASLGVWASIQACHGVSDAVMAPRRLGQNRMKDAYRARTFLDADARLCNGTDFPIEPVSPLRSYVAAWRRTELDPEALPFMPEEALTREEALLAMTAWTAEAEFAEGDTGRLDPGCWMDATVLSHDPLEASIEELAKTSVQGTIVRGERVFSVEGE